MNDRLRLPTGVHTAILPPAAATLMFDVYVECPTCGAAAYTGITMSGDATTSVEESTCTCPDGHRHSYSFTVRPRGPGE